MKKFLKVTGMILGILILLLAAVILYFRYEFQYKRTEIATSLEGSYTVTMYQIGEPGFPFGPVAGEFVLKRDDMKINTLSFIVYNDGGGLVSEDAVFYWESDCVKIRVSGSEQDDMMYTLRFDGSSYSEKASPWFTDEEVIDMIKETYGEQPTVNVEEYDRTNMYNELYTRIDEVLHGFQEDIAGGNTLTGEAEDEEIRPEILDYYMSIEPSSSFLSDSGMEYRMVAVDRALGSSFYVLVGTMDGGKTYAFVNPDPYNGSGGESRWIIFLDDELGFSCLTHAAGTYGSLYRTEDGGKSWEEIDYPSSKAKLPDGTYYNPFVMPEKVYEEDGILYMEVGQGADGDYHDDELGFCHGLYRSPDEGMQWEFVESIPVNR